MVPDRHVDKAGYIEYFAVAAGKTVTPGRAVKLSSSLTNPNIREIEEAVALADIPIGIAGGNIGDNNLVDTATNRAVAGRTAYIAGDKIPVTLFYTVVEWAIAGAAGVTAGSRVAVDVASTTGALVNAPAMGAAGSTATHSPGVALDTAAVGEAFALAIMPAFYPSA